MFSILQVFTKLLVAVAMALALAHALEFTGKMRLTKDALGNLYRGSSSVRSRGCFRALELFIAHQH